MKMPLSPLEVRVLSELRHFRRGTSPTNLARHVGVARASLYVILRRLAKRRCVSRERQRVPGRNEHQVLYAITAAGRKARSDFARKVGLRA
jgi:DNA-binding MarR family transcriptional regulator